MTSLVESREVYGRVKANLTLGKLQLEWLQRIGLNVSGMYLNRGDSSDMIPLGVIYCL